MKIDASAASPSKKTIAIRNITLSDELFAGACAGVAARVLTAPFDVIKIRFQLQNPDNPKYRSMLQAFRSVISEEGLFALWKGNISATFLWVSYAMVQFAAYGMLKKWGEEYLAACSQAEAAAVPEVAPAPAAATSNGGDVSIPSIPSSFQEKPPFSFKRSLVLFFAGAAAGMLATTSTYPFDIMRTQFAVQGRVKVYSTMSHFIADTFKRKGIAGFYAGLTPAVAGITPYMGLNFALFESLSSLLNHGINLPFFNANKRKSNDFVGGNGEGEGGEEKYETKTEKNAKLGNSQLKQNVKNLAKNGLCGGLAGGASKFIVYPLDTIKKRLQAQMLSVTMDSAMTAQQQAVRYRGILHCAASILQNEGVQGFYKGIIPTTAKSVVATAITFATYEAAKDVLSGRKKHAQR